MHLGLGLGLYAALHDLGPATSTELAARAGDHQRYAHEWLEHQAVGGLLDVAVVSHDPEARRSAANGLADRPSVGAGTVMRPAAFRAFAHEAGFRAVTILPIEDDAFRFYRLDP